MRSKRAVLKREGTESVQHMDKLPPSFGRAKPRDNLHLISLCIAVDVIQESDIELMRVALHGYLVTTSLTYTHGIYKTIYHFT